MTVTLPQNLLSTQHTLHEDFEDSLDWAAGGGAVLATDNVNFKTGAASLKLTAGVGVESNATRIGLDLDMSDAVSWRIHFYVEDVSKVFSVTLRLGSNAASTAVDFYQHIWTQAGLVTGWNAINMILSDWTLINGSPDWSSIKRIHVRAFSQAGEQAVVSYDRLAAGVLGTCAVKFQFDDNYESVLNEAYPVLHQYGMRATCYVISDKIGVAGRLSPDNLGLFNALGWDMANHTKTHSANLDTLNLAEQTAELSGCETALDGYGFTRASNHVAYPAGAWNADTLTAMTNLGMLTGRGTDEKQHNFLPTGSNYYTKTKAYLHNTRTLVQAKGYLDDALARGEIVEYVLHDLVAAPGVDSEWPIDDFVALVEYVSQKGVPVLTISDFYNLQSGPVTIPDYWLNYPNKRGVSFDRTATPWMFRRFSSDS